MLLPLNSIYARAALLSAAFAAGALASCSVGEQNQDAAKYPSTNAPAAPAPSLRQQTKAVRTYAKTTFKLVGIDEAKLAGLDVRPLSAGATLPPAQASQLTDAARGAESVPLLLRLRLEARNPNRDKVMLNELEYQILVDNRRVAIGSTDDVLEIKGRSILSIPLTITTDVRDAMAAGLKPEHVLTAFGTWNQKTPRLSVRVRPTFQNTTGRAFRTTDFEPIQASIVGK